MASLCLDTDVVVGIIRGAQPIDSLMALIPLGVSTTIVTIMELYYGAHKSGKEERIGIVDNVCKSITVMDILEKDAKLAGKIMAELDKEGKKLDFRDVMIGSICINNDMVLVTNNTKHFERMEKYGLSVESMKKIA